MGNTGFYEELLGLQDPWRVKKEDLMRFEKIKTIKKMACDFRN